MRPSPKRDTFDAAFARAMTQREMCEVTRLSQPTISRLLLDRLNARPRLAHISAWQAATKAGPPVATYSPGPGRDVPCTLTRSSNGRTCAQVSRASNPPARAQCLSHRAYELAKMNNQHTLPLNVEDWDVIICPVSGGKDSQTLLSLAIETPGVREKLIVCHQFTGYDHSATYAHLQYMREHYGVQITDTRNARFTDIFDLIEKERFFPSSLARSCTSRMKIMPFALWLHTSGFTKQRTLVLLGMRGNESRNRAEQYADITAADYFSICDISKEYQKKAEAHQGQPEHSAMEH